MIGERLFCGLDIGSQRIKASLIKAKKGHVELLGVYESLTRGLKKESVNDLNELADCMRYCLKGLTKRTSVKIKDIRLGIGGNLVESRYSSTMIPLLDKGIKIITTGDVKKVNKQACLLGMDIQEEILHEFSQSYVVDENNSVTNPIGLYGRKLGTQFLLITSKVNLVSNITKAVNQAGYEVCELAFSSCLAAEASLKKKSKHSGCVLIDSGSNTTDVLIYKDGFLRELDVINSGGDDITSSIAKALDLPFGLAEEIKKSYAVVLSDNVRHDGEILVKRETEYIPIRRETVCQAMEPEVSRLIKCINDTIKCSKIYDQIEAGITMVGGGSLLSGLIERVEKVTHLPVDVGKVSIAMNKLSHPAVFSAAVGLAQSGTNKSLNHTFKISKDSTRLNYLTNRVKEWYQEYF